MEILTVVKELTQYEKQKESILRYQKKKLQDPEFVEKRKEYYRKKLQEDEVFREKNKQKALEYQARVREKLQKLKQLEEILKK